MLINWRAPVTGTFFLSISAQGAEAKHLLGESLYAGQLEGEPECAAHAFIEDNQVNH